MSLTFAKKKRSGAFVDPVLPAQGREVFLQKGNKK
jgi:hypothetical protein